MTTASSGLVIIGAERFGARFGVPHRAVSLTRHDGAYVVSPDDGRVLQARAVVIACGVQYRRLPLERLQDFEAAGVLVCSRL